MTQQEAVTRWAYGSNDSLETAQQLLQSGKYHHALFFLHLSLEKMLKALIVKSTDAPPLPIHDLLRLAAIADVVISEKKTTWLAEISTFNIAARYDDEKLKFYKKATREYAMSWFDYGQKLLDEWRKLI